MFDRNTWNPLIVGKNWIIGITLQYLKPFSRVWTELLVLDSNILNHLTVYKYNYLG